MLHKQFTERAWLGSGFTGNRTGQEFVGNAIEIGTLGLQAFRGGNPCHADGTGIGFVAAHGEAFATVDKNALHSFCHVLAHQDVIFGNVIDDPLLLLQKGPRRADTKDHAHQQNHRPDEDLLTKGDRLGLHRRIVTRARDHFSVFDRLRFGGGKLVCVIIDSHGVFQKRCGLG